MNFLTKMLIKALAIIPINLVLGYVLDMVEEWAKGTPNKLDDAMVRIARAFLGEASITASGVELTPALTGVLGDWDYKTIVRSLINGLKKMAEATETDVDDAFVEAIESLLLKYKLI